MREHVSVEVDQQKRKEVVEEVKRVVMDGGDGGVNERMIKLSL